MSFQASPHALKAHAQRFQGTTTVSIIRGEYPYEGDMAPFLPLLKAGEALHVGKGTTFELGRYEMRIQ